MEGDVYGLSPGLGGRLFAPRWGVGRAPEVRRERIVCYCCSFCDSISRLERKSVGAWLPSSKRQGERTLEKKHV